MTSLIYYFFVVTSNFALFRLSIKKYNIHWLRCLNFMVYIIMTMVCMVICKYGYVWLYV